MMERSKAYFLSRTPRQIGLENTVEELYEAKEKLLPESLQKEWLIFPSKSIIYQTLDTIPDPSIYENYYVRSQIDATNEEIALARSIYGAINIAEGLRLITYNMISLQEYADKYGKDSVNVRQKCLRGCVAGAVNIGRDWMVPKDIPYTDFRSNAWTKEKNSMNIRPSTHKKEYFLNKTPRQVGMECTGEYLEESLKELVPEPLWNKWHLFGSMKLVMNRLDTIQTPEAYEEIVAKKNLTYTTPEQMAIACTIHCALCVVDAKNALFYHVLPLKEYARRIGKVPDIVRQKCLRGNVEGAVKIGTMWFIPETTDYDKRVRAWRNAIPRSAANK